MTKPTPKPWSARYNDKRIERIARKFCEGIGIDPDEVVRRNHACYMLEGEYKPVGMDDVPGRLWQLYRADVQRALAMQDALAWEDGLSGT